uniref:Centrosomal protein of 162 kDa n=1 Tax=Anopheles farauti TaxID=69004 RepID=A0A182Q2R5_9DIPT
MPTEPDGIGKWSPNSIEPECRQTCVASADTSLDEFLEHELVCWLNEDKPIGEEVAVLYPELYGELSHLFRIAANETDNRCVEDILSEAERLMQETPLPTDVRNQPQQSSPMGWNELLQPSELVNGSLPSGMARQQQLGSNHQPHQNGHQNLKDPDWLDCNNGTGDSQFSLRVSDSDIAPSVQSSSPPPLASKKVSPQDSPARRQQQQQQHDLSSSCSTATIKTTSTQRQRRHSAITELSTAMKNTHDVLSLYVQCVRNQYETTRTKQDATTNTVDPEVCDRSTQPSPTLEEAAADSWAKDRHLRTRILEIQDRLKDTEERYKSAKMLLDGRSAAYRNMHELYSAIQQENDKLQFDIRNITKGADLIKSQLQDAQSDRDAAIELQKIFQLELEASRTEKRRLQDGAEKDRRMIQDLQRQCREMERILTRKYPDNVSKLIVGFKTKDEQGSTPSSNRQQLVQQIEQLQADAKKQDATAQGILEGMHAQFNSVQTKYETHIADLEMQVLSLQEINAKLSEKIARQAKALDSLVPVAPPSTDSSYTQIDSDCGLNPPAAVPMRSSAIQTDEIGSSEPAAATRAVPATKKPAAVAPGKEDAHLLATIRGMRIELANKEKTVHRLTRELEECKKTIRKLQKKLELPAGGPAVPAVPAKNDNGRKLRNRDDRDDAETKLRNLQAIQEQERESFQKSIRCLQQQLAECEQKLLQRSNLRNVYYGLKAKRKRSLLKRIVVPQGRLIPARKCWMTATGGSKSPSVVKGLVQALLRNDLNHYTKAKSCWLRQVVATGDSNESNFVQHPDCSSH